MPSLIRKRGVLRYKGKVPIPDQPGKTKERLFPDNSENSRKKALEWEIKTELELKADMSQRQFPTHSDYVTIQEWANAHLEDAETRCVKQTFNEKHAAFKRLFAFPHVRSDLTVDILANGHDGNQTTIAYGFLKFQKTKRGGNAANKDRKNLARAWNWGVKYIANFPRNMINPFSVVEPFSRIKKPRYVPPESDFWKIYDVAEGQDKIMLLTYYKTAARKSEIFRLQRSDLDFNQGQVRLWTRKRRGGDFEYDWLPMDAELKRDLESWLEYRFSQPTIDDKHVFVCLDQSPFTDQYYGKPFLHRQHLMKRLCKRAKVPRFDFHSIRHLVATKLYHEGKSLSYIQWFLRHTSANTTVNYLKSLGIDAARRKDVGLILTRPKVINLDQKKKAS